MPLIQVTTNQAEGISETHLQRISKEIAALLGKPEQYVMVNLNHSPHMYFAGSGAPLAYVELKSLGLPEQETVHLSQALCGLLSELFAIPEPRIYIEFSSPPRHLWGWNSSTF